VRNLNFITVFANKLVTASRYRKTEQITVNHNRLQKRKWDTLCILTATIESAKVKARFPYGRKNRVTIFFNGQFIIVYTCQPHINHKYSLVLTPRIFSSKMLYFGWWERSWLNLYDRYDHMETRLSQSKSRTLKLIFNSKIVVKSSIKRIYTRPLKSSLW
jgi:hypothetical protein